MPPRKVAVLLPTVISKQEFRQHYKDDIESEGLSVNTRFIMMGCMLFNCTLHDFIRNKGYTNYQFYVAGIKKYDVDFDDYKEQQTKKKKRVTRNIKPCRLYLKKDIKYFKTTEERDAAIVACDRIIFWNRTYVAKNIVSNNGLLTSKSQVTLSQDDISNFKSKFVLAFHPLNVDDNKEIPEDMNPSEILRRKMGARDLSPRTIGSYEIINSSTSSLTSSVSSSSSSSTSSSSSSTFSLTSSTSHSSSSSSSSKTLINIPLTSTSFIMSSSTSSSPVLCDTTVRGSSPPTFDQRCYDITPGGTQRQTRQTRHFDPESAIETKDDDTSFVSISPDTIMYSKRMTQDVGTHPATISGIKKAVAALNFTSISGSVEGNETPDSTRSSSSDGAATPKIVPGFEIITNYTAGKSN
jgi:hypothetical protein